MNLNLVLAFSPTAQSQELPVFPNTHRPLMKMFSFWVSCGCPCFSHKMYIYFCLLFILQVENKNGQWLTED